jgi:hypothetical protein
MPALVTTSADIAGAAAFSCSDAARFIVAARHR